MTMIAQRGKRLTMNASTRLWWGSPRTLFVNATVPSLTLRLPPADAVPPGTVFNFVIIDEPVAIADATGATLVASAAADSRVRAWLRADLTWATY